MAHFYGTLQGARGEASRLGGKDSGLDTVAASWEGAIAVTLYHENGVDKAQVRMRRWHGHGVERLLYDGTVGVFDPLGLKVEDTQVEPAWSDLKIAFHTGDAPAFLSHFDAGKFTLPKGWEWCEYDGSGARWVTVFRVAGFPTAQDGANVAALVEKWGA